MDGNDLMFLYGIIAALSSVFIIKLIYICYKWVKKINNKLIDHQWKLKLEEEDIANLRARVKVLEMVDDYHRINNTSHNEEGIGSINPSEADTE